MTAVETEVEAIEADDHIRTLVNRWNDLKFDRDRIEQEMREITAEVAGRVTKRAIWEQNDETVAVSVVRSSTKVVDFEMLKAVDPALFEAVTRTKVELDPEAFEKARDLGLFANGTPAAKALTFKPKAPSLRFGTYSPREEGADDNA